MHIYPRKNARLRAHAQTPKHANGHSHPTSHPHTNVYAHTAYTHTHPRTRPHIQRPAHPHMHGQRTCVNTTHPHADAPTNAPPAPHTDSPTHMSLPATWWLLSTDSKKEKERVADLEAQVHSPEPQDANDQIQAHEQAGLH
jgi:hypothetical protein